MGFIAWRLLRSRWAFTIVVDNTGVRSHTGIKTPQQCHLLSLFQRTRFVDGRVTIRGRTDENGQLQLTFIGPIDDATKQQVRNFLLNEL
ncbi:MAG: hypothetical protein GY758_30945 [Fuerstiella sp.]|nr:hypothetical protein [Fuerstiella sp.]